MRSGNMYFEFFLKLVQIKVLNHLMQLDTLGRRRFKSDFQDTEYVYGRKN